MSSLFRNNYKVYLYKYNYKALQSKVESILNENSASKFLFESFVTNLYTLGIPSDEVIKEVSSKYLQYVEEFKNKKPNISNANQNVIKNTGDSRTIEYKPIKENSDFIVKHERATISAEDNLLQEALAQNYALQKLQRDYEDGKMKESSAKINWMSTIESRQTYDTYIKNALDASKKLLDELFKPVIDELATIQSSGRMNSQYVYVIELTNLTQSGVIEKVVTDRTKYSDDDFMRTTANRVLPDDVNHNALDSIGAISTTLEGLSNMTSFNLRQDILLHYGVTIEANDIIEIVDTNYNNMLQNGKNYVAKRIEDSTQFIGFVTKMSLSQRFNETSLLNVTCEGISKMLSLNPTINSNAVAPQFKSVAGFISGEDKTQTTSDANVVNVFSTFFDGLNAYDLFIKLLSDTLAVTPVEEDKAAYSMRLVSDPEKLKTLPYQYAKPLLVLYHYAVTYSTLRKVNLSGAQSQGSHIILARLDNNVNQEKLQAYLLMIRSQFDLFWSNITTPITVLQTLANNTFLEIFEDRSGILILRPPRYNTWIEGDVINEDTFIEWTQSIDDSSLKSRSDYQWSIPALGIQNEFCGGYYQDIPALLKYGFRADSPKSSPSVQSEIDAAVYSALDVTKANSNTRTFELTVPLTQDYKLGRLYYFPESASVDKYGTLSSKGFVGYLTNITTTIAPGNVDVHRLTFKYMRSAECLEVNTKTDVEGSTDDSLAGKFLTILNFKRLPELSMYQSSVTEDMLTKTQQDNLKEKAHRLVSNSRYYWASYNGPNKIVFDDAINRDRILSTSEYKKLYRTMAPTNIRVGDFKSLNDVKSSDFVPSQQLINSIWCADILSRTGYSEDDYELNTKDTSVNAKIYTRQLRTRDNSDNVLKYLWKDRTIKSINEVNYLNKDSEKYSAPYATVNQKVRDGNQDVSLGAFLILDSIMPNINTEFASEYNSFIKTYMRNVIVAFQKYEGDDSYYKWYTSGLVNLFKTEQARMDAYSYQMTLVKDCIDAFNIAESNIYKFDAFYSKYEKAKPYMDKLLEYYDDRHSSTVLKQFNNLLSRLNPAVTLGKKLSDFLGMTDAGINFVKELINNVKVGIPAYLVNTNSQLPAVHTLQNTGSYIAGVCPIDYTPYIRQLGKNILSSLLNGNVTFKNKNILNASGVSIGTITKLIYDSELSDGVNLYFYPVIEFVNDNELTKVYNGMQNLRSTLESTYMCTEEEINSFLRNRKSDKNVACVIRVTPTCIPETKIPTIEQVYNQDGLYVGYDKKDDKSFANSRKAIFDPTVLFKWNSSEVTQLYTVNVYNFIECCSSGNKFATYLSCNSKKATGFLNIELHSKKIPWDTMIKNNNICRVPCVTNTRLAINKLDIPEISNDMANKIRNYFISLSIANAFEIDNCNDSDIPTGYMYIEDLKALDNGTTQLALTYDFQVQLSAAHNVLISDDLSSSRTIDQDKSIKSSFMNSVEDKEYTQVSLYNFGPYMPLDTKDWYPNHFLIGRFFLVRKRVEIYVKRKILDNNKTIGEMYVNNSFFCHTLEDTYRGDVLAFIKIDNHTCIPNGRYEIYNDLHTLGSDTSAKNYPTLKDVPYFSGILVHTGSGTEDTKGCILVGDYKNNVWTPNKNYVTKLVSLISVYPKAYITVSIDPNTDIN